LKDYIEIGPTPVEEDCVQVGADNYGGLARRECNVFIEQLRRVFGTEPEGARLAIKRNPHDFGEYLEVVCHYDDELPDSVEYAFKLEAKTPANWDDEAKAKLELP
jgi:hypothetical protein